MKITTTTDYWYTSYYPKNEAMALMKTDREDLLNKGINSCKDLASGLEAKLKLLASQV